MMPHNNADEIREFLAAIDRHLGSPVRIIIIGGSAAFFHGATSTTTDIDTESEISAAMNEAITAARAETRLDIPVNRSTVADYPHNYEDRLERVMGELKYLEVFILEKHDLALSKAVRCNDHDLKQLSEIHEADPFNCDTLVSRFRDEMDHATGDRDVRRSNFLDLIERLFGELKREAVAAVLPVHRW
jgi:hypothetical protein